MENLLNLQTYQILTAVISVVFLGLFVRSLLTWMLSMGNYKIHKKRLDQLKQQRGKDDIDLSELIDNVTRPIISVVFSEFRPRKLDELEVMLKMSGWNKMFTPLSFRALNLLFKIIGVVVGVGIWQINKPIAIAWGAALFFGLGFFMKNTYTNRKERLMLDFPDFIRITEGYLSANMSFARAVTESIQYVGDEWKPILQKFAVEIDVRGIDEALDNLKNEVDLFDVREFVSLVRLALERGGDAKSSFKAQAERIREMQIDIMAIKIGQRQTMSIMLQGPLLISSMAMFALPTVGAMMEFGAF